MQLPLPGWNLAVGGVIRAVTKKGDVCDSCLEAVYEAAMSVGEQCDDLLYTYMLARTTGGNVFDHECAADDEEVDCHCGCQSNL